MPIQFTFDKARAEHFADALLKGKPIEGARLGRDLFTLAGACLYAMRGLALQHPEMATARQGHPEHQEAKEETLERDLVAAIRLAASLTHVAVDPRTTDRVGAEVAAVVESTDAAPFWMTLQLDGWKKE